MRWFKARENIAVCVMAAVVLGLHVPLIDTPHAELSTPEWMRQDQAYKDDNTRTAPAPQYIFDELHYIPEAIRFLHREYPEQEHGIVRGEHPPLSKWLIASGIVIFGDNPVGWRVLPILFGIASIFIFYLICRRLVGQEPGLCGCGVPRPPAPLGWR
ncbi:MAG: glycosyltransferase family 39 protein [Chloroflexi bacterium]|nr:glycosyltransferase family 39 protein [Chloroflexota bacterium]